jgi:hypothetical protein
VVGLFGTKTTHLQCVGEFKLGDSDLESSVKLVLKVEEWRWFMIPGEFSGVLFVNFLDKGFNPYYYFHDRGVILTLGERTQRTSDGSLLGTYYLDMDRFLLDDTTGSSELYYSGQCEKFTPALL